MLDEMTIEDYLAEGGVLTSPEVVPPRYRAELMRLMATFVDSELAGAAGFADIINQGPGVKERIAAAKIVLEKTDHGAKVLRIMGDFGADAERYANHHPWTERLEREADIGATRARFDMRLAVFNYPLHGWSDAVAMNLLMGLAVGVQLEDYQSLSYQPLAEIFREIAPREKRHAELAEEGLIKMLGDENNRASIQGSVDYWWPRVALSFGTGTSNRDETLRKWGLRQRSSGALKSNWEAVAQEALHLMSLKTPGQAENG